MAEEETKEKIEEKPTEGKKSEQISDEQAAAIAISLSKEREEQKNLGTKEKSEKFEKAVLKAEFPGKKRARAAKAKEDEKRVKKVEKFEKAVLKAESPGKKRARAAKAKEDEKRVKKFGKAALKAESPGKKSEKASVPKKKKGGWFQKVPTRVLLSPGGMILIAFAGIMELIDLIPIPIIDQLWELPLELAFIALFVIIVKDVSWKALVIPFGVERIAVINDIVPSFLLKMFM